MVQGKCCSYMIMMMILITQCHKALFPTCQVRVVRLYVSGTASKDQSGPRRTRTASPRSEWSPPDLNSKPWIRVVPAGPEQQVPDQSGSRWAPQERMPEENVRENAR